MSLPPPPPLSLGGLTYNECLKIAKVANKPGFLLNGVPGMCTLASFASACFALDILAMYKTKTHV